MWRLLRGNISKAQFAGYALANFVGLTIVLCAIQLYVDLSAAFGGEESFMMRDYVSVSHKVDGLSGLTSSGVEAMSFDSVEVADIERQPWAARVGKYVPATFNVAMSVGIGGEGMSTALFFESVPDEFFDRLPSDWSWDPEHPVIPIVLGREYLALYNFGFATSRGLPKLSEEMISLAPLKVSISGLGRQEWMPARIVGFSSRLNTVAVPQSFMEWANERYGERRPAVSRLIVELSGRGDPAIDSYLKAHGLEMSGDNNDRTGYYVTIVAGVVMVVGAVICVLAVVILMLSLYLLMQKSSGKLHDLMLLGYSPKRVAGQYYRAVAAVNGAVLIAALATTAVCRGIWMKQLSAPGMTEGSLWPYVVAGVGAMCVVTAINFAAISRLTRRYFKTV